MDEPDYDNCVCLSLECLQLSTHNPGTKASAQSVAAVQVDFHQHGWRVLFVPSNKQFSCIIYIFLCRCGASDESIFYCQVDIGNELFSRIIYKNKRVSWSMEFTTVLYTRKLLNCYVRLATMGHICIIIYRTALYISPCIQHCVCTILYISLC